MAGTTDRASTTGRRAGRPSICLAMIVRNEAHIITETLASVVAHVDHWIVVDTGSTDDTIGVVERFFAEAGVPGSVHERPWRNFGHNRTEALELARDRGDYTLMMDADDVLMGSPDLETLTAEGYNFRLDHDGFVYLRTLLFRNDRGWAYAGVLHEYPHCTDGPADIREIEGDCRIRYRSEGDRSRDPDRFDRDAAILRAAHDDDPNDPRTVFYLAQSYRDAGRPADALEWYQHRIAMGGWDQETFWAMLQRARLLDALDEQSEYVVDAYLDCWQFRPRRAEPLHDLAVRYRLAGDFHLGHLFASRAAEIEFPADEQLFIERDVYTWRARDTRAICAFYIGNYRESFDLCAELLRGDDLPEEQRPRVHENRDFSVPFVKDETLVYPAEQVAACAAAAAGTPSRPAPEPGIDAVTVTITSCRRPDLFAQTVNSFLNCVTDLDRVHRWVCVDDGSSPADRARMQEQYPFFEFIWKDRADAGHARSMNLLRDTVDTTYWLHLEDDWHFFVPGAHIGRAIDVLTTDGHLGQVLFNRTYAEALADRDLVGGVVDHPRGGPRHWIQEHFEGDALAAYFAALPPGARTNAWWPHFSLRPSLMRTSMIHDLGPFDETADHFELDYARHYTAAGHRTAGFDDIMCLHLGPLTSDRGPERAPNAYDLNDQAQFGPSPTPPTVSTPGP
jgi:glycosyltransferase involved in cell wall biosynthesis